MTDYEKFTTELDKKIAKRKKQIRIRKIIWAELKKFAFFFYCLAGTIILQLGYGQYKLVKVFWIFLIFIFAATIWYIVEDLVIIFNEENK